MGSFAYLKKDSELRAIFPDGTVPIVSIVPAVPREEGAPLCYWVKGSELNDEQVEQLAERIFEEWRPECESLQQAREYVRNDLPLKTTHFSGGGTDDYSQILWDAAILLRGCGKHEQDSAK